MADYDDASPDEKKLWNVLNRSDVIARMETASDLGQPALSPVEDILLEEMGATIMQKPLKQLAGRMTKTILERQGFEHDASGLRLNSVPFYKASRYRRRDQTGLYLFKNSADPRDICLTDTRRGEKMPSPGDGHWMYVNYFTSPLKASIGFDINLRDAAAQVDRTGYFRHNVPRATRAG